MTHAECIKYCRMHRAVHKLPDTGRWILENDCIHNISPIGADIRIAAKANQTIKTIRAHSTHSNSDTTVYTYTSGYNGTGSGVPFAGGLQMRIKHQ